MTIDIDALVAKCFDEGRMGGPTTSVVRSALLECERLTREECAKVLEGRKWKRVNTRFQEDENDLIDELIAAIRGMK